MGGASKLRCGGLLLPLKQTPEINPECSRDSLANAYYLSVRDGYYFSVNSTVLSLHVNDY